MISRALIIIVLCELLQCAVASSQASSVLYYNAPADRDFYSGLPIGNGRLGGTIHGYTDQELIRLNEESIWSGGPRDRVNPDALPNLPTLRKQLVTGQLSEADDNWIANFTGVPSDMRAYQPAGELRIDFPHPFNNTTGYNRTLDISNGMYALSYEYDGVTYTREAFANGPSNILAFKLAASKPGALSFNVGLTRDQNVTTLSADAKARSIVLSGTGSVDDYFKFASKAQIVLPPGTGRICANKTALKITGATEAWIFYDAETSYQYPDGSWESVVDSRLQAAVESTYSALQSEAIEDYKQYYDRTSVDFGTSDAMGQLDLPTRIQTWQKGNNITDDPELLALAFNMGKYLLIQSSRPGTLPANLQGVWNRDFIPPWDSKFTLNINLEMNYWLAQPLNLPEISEPVYDMLNNLRVTGAHVAKEMYDAKGFTCHHNTDITSDCVPYHASSIFSPFPLGGAWLSFEAIEHWRFTGNDAFAKETALPILKDSIEFFYTYVVERDGYYVTSPGCSPENSYIIPDNMSVAGSTTGLDAGVMVDRSIMWEVLTGFLDMSAALDLTEGVTEAEAFRSKIQGVAVGSTGRLLEWSQEFEENEPGHRHFSPLVCVHPGTWVSPLKNKTASDAAYKLLRWRMDNGSGGTSWSVVWASVLHARLFDGANALVNAITYVGRWVWPSMMSRNGGYFQIDGNSGITSALIEMLLQSHAGVIHLGPALPKSGLSSGSFRGFVARGGFLVDMTWEDGMVTGATITSSQGKLLLVRVQDGRSFHIDGAVETSSMKTNVGQKYTVTF